MTQKIGVNINKRVKYFAYLISSNKLKILKINIGKNEIMKILPNILSPKKIEKIEFKYLDSGI